jgi:hypothetical protein
MSKFAYLIMAHNDAYCFSKLIDFYVAFQIIGKYLLLFNYLLFNILREYDDS